MPDTKTLAEEIFNNKGTDKLSHTKLETDEKVLARITDGIYRLPGSALRELISNAYDADAENVIIDTDVPRFESITIRDDGNGMSIDTLVNLIGHIGGSAKRNDKGIDLSVTDSSDSSLSPKKKRKLIGKIGIGLFSVAQLTRDFDIITKQKGNDYYLKARVKLHNYSDESNQQKERGKSFETGDVQIWTELTSNKFSHGTDIILNNIKQSAADILKSVDVWGQETAETEPSDDFSTDLLNTSKLETPEFHVGILSGDEGYESFGNAKERNPNLPWDESDKAGVRFPKLYEAILNLTKNTVSPKLSIVLDNYLNMIWTLGLSVPLDYIDGHPFKLNLHEMPDCYSISNKHKGQATPIKYDDESVSIHKKIPLSTNTKTTGFNVIIDNIKLFRPIKFLGLPESRAIVKKPIFFIGSYSPDLSSIDLHDSAGELSFDAYILWSPKVIPRDHTGVLVRLHNASGIMFDETFMKHQVAEHTIKSQLTIEIFINKGLDSALNIDRESFNISHPHYQIVMRWLHQAIRQVINKYKAIKKELATTISKEHQTVFKENLNNVVETSLRKRGVDTTDKKPNLYLLDEGSDASENIDSFKITKKKYLEVTNLNTLKNRKSRAIKEKTEALLQLLESYSLLEYLSPSQQESLIIDFLKIASIEE